MAEAYDYMKDLGPAAAEGPGAVYLALAREGRGFRRAVRLDKLCGIAAGATDVAYTIAIAAARRARPRPGADEARDSGCVFRPAARHPARAPRQRLVGLVALTETLSSVDARVVAEYWPGELADLYRAKAVLDNLNGRFGAGAVRRLAAKLTARG